MLFPWLKHIMPEWSGYNTWTRAVNGMLEMIDSAKNQHEEFKKEGDEQGARDFIDEYLK